MVKIETSLVAHTSTTAHAYSSMAQKVFVSSKILERNYFHKVLHTKNGIFYQNEKLSHMIEYDVTNDIWFGFNEDKTKMMLMPTFSFLFYKFWHTHV